MQFVHDNIRAGKDCVHSGAAWERDVSYGSQKHSSDFEYNKSVCKAKYW